VVIDVQGDAFAVRVVNGRIKSLKEGWRASDRVASEFKGDQVREEAEDVVDGIQYDRCWGARIRGAVIDVEVER